MITPPKLPPLPFWLSPCVPFLIVNVLSTVTHGARIWVWMSPTNSGFACLLPGWWYCWGGCRTHRSKGHAAEAYHQEQACGGYQDPASSLLAFWYSTMWTATSSDCNPLIPYPTCIPSEGSTLWSLGPNQSFLVQVLPPGAPWQRCTGGYHTQVCLS